MNGATVKQIFADDGVLVEIFDTGELAARTVSGVSPEFGYLARLAELPVNMADRYVITEITSVYPAGTVLTWNAERQCLCPENRGLPNLHLHDLDEYWDIMEECKSEEGSGFYTLTLTDNAGLLSVHANSRAILDEALGVAKGLVETVKADDMGSFEGDPADDCYYVSRQSEYKSSLAEVVAKLHGSRKLWWQAEDAAELQRTLQEILENGAKVLKVVPDIPSQPAGPFSVVFSINPKDAHRFFGSTIDVSSYLDESLLTL
jgi:hypothetical protein